VTPEISLEVKDLQARFQAYAKSVETKLDRALVRCGMRVERDAKLKFKGKDEPSVKGEPPRVQTGRARASITHRLDAEETGPFVEVGTNVEYAKKLEVGSSTTWPHPFLTPAAEENKDFIRAELREAMK